MVFPPHHPPRGLESLSRAKTSRLAAAGVSGSNFNSRGALISEKKTLGTYFPHKAYLR